LPTANDKKGTRYSVKVLFHITGRPIEMVPTLPSVLQYVELLNVARICCASVRDKRVATKSLR